MNNFHPEARFGQPLFDLFSNKDRTMLAAGAAKADSQIALPFTYIVRDQVNQQA